MHAKLLQLCLTVCGPMDVAHQAPLSMGFFRQEYWTGLPCPPPGDLLDLGIKPYVSCIGRKVLSHELHLGSPFIMYPKLIYLFIRTNKQSTSKVIKTACGESYNELTGQEVQILVLAQQQGCGRSVFNIRLSETGVYVCVYVCVYIHTHV